MVDFRRVVIALALSGTAILGVSCSGGVPAEPSPLGDGGATSSASAVSNTDSPQPTPSRQGAHLLGRVLNELGEPVADCLVQIEGDTNEHAIVSGSDGKFEAGIAWGAQTLIINCRSEQYVETRVAFEVPKTEEVTQDFTVQSR
ncbi:MAG: hypothetical protein Q4D79_09220 [Propionibacteriaceae bacterium]|nr:hypothetical protein [Propionibacteriaceae bacterium]